MELVRESVLASTAVPGVFPPVMIDAVTEGGKHIQEMHDDGGSMSPYYLAPAATLAGVPDGGSPLPASTVYLVINNRLTPEFGLVPRTVLGVLVIVILANGMTLLQVDPFYQVGIRGAVVILAVLITGGRKAIDDVVK